MVNLDNIATEQRNTSTLHIDELSTIDMLRVINNEDKKVAEAVGSALAAIAVVVDETSNRIKNGGHLIYIGAGTSGRLGLLDAAECPPTFGTNPETVQGIIAGGYHAVFRAKEGAEDDPHQAEKDLKKKKISSKDVIVGLAASGRTPYTTGALRYAREIGAFAVAVVCSPDSPMSQEADITILVEPGPEVITGSTRLKAGTAEKMVLNMISTGCMIKLGKVYENLMVDVKATNDKLAERAKRIVMEATGCTRDKAIESLSAAKGNAKLAICMQLTGTSADDAQKLLSDSHGYLSQAVRKGINH